MISLVFIRHGATKGNLEKKYIGRTDEPLCDVGIKQAMKLKEYGFCPDYIFVSPMLRTIQTAEIIFPERKYIIEENFKETDFGVFEGKSAFELSENEEYKLWVNSMCTLPVPNGESIMEFKKRCIDAFRRVINSIPDNANVSFVIHGGVIMAILEALGESEGSFYDYHIENGEFLPCVFEDGKIRT